MSKLVKRIRISKEADQFMTKMKLKKQTFIENAIVEKLKKEFGFKINCPF